MQDYRIQLDAYSGPMDLLLYLIRREEVDIYDIPISTILEQYLTYVKLLEDLDPEAVGDFLVMAATLMEIKSRMLLPRLLPEQGEGETDVLDPRADLVRQLLAYRSFRQAASELSQRAEQHSRRFGRPATQLPEQERHFDIEDIQIWDLLGAFNKLMASVGTGRVFHEVKYDDTPITLHADDILDRLQHEGQSMYFEQVFEGRTRSQMIGLFLALLELIRQKRIRIDQQERFGPIQIHLLDATPIQSPELLEENQDRETADATGSEELNAGMTTDDLEKESRESYPQTAIEDDMDEVEDEDNYSQRLKSIRIGNVDLGREMEAGHDSQDDHPTPSSTDFEEL